jgi:5'(3')-deoxyribonucleotidase
MKTIVWDVDDVLNDLMRDWLENWWRVEHPECRIAYSEINQNPPHQVLGISFEDYLDSLDRFRFSAGAEMKPVAEVVNWFKEFGSNFRHIALTAVPMKAADISAAWVYKYFGYWIRSFNVVPSPRKENLYPQYDHSKKEYLQWWGKGDIFIDDNLKNVSEIRELGLTSILMPAPWNKSLEKRSAILHSLINMPD